MRGLVALLAFLIAGPAMAGSNPTPPRRAVQTVPGTAAAHRPAADWQPAPAVDHSRVNAISQARKQ